MPLPRGPRFGAGRGRADAADSAATAGARGGADERGRPSSNISVPLCAGVFLAGALVEKLFSRVIFRREPRGLQKASYCMMMAPPPGPAHSIELRLTHGLCAGSGGHHAPQPHAPQQQAMAPPQLPADLMTGMADELPLLFDRYDAQLSELLGLGGPSPQPWQAPPPPPAAAAPPASFAPGFMAYGVPAPPPPGYAPLALAARQTPAYAPVPPEQAAAAALLLAPPAAAAPQQAAAPAPAARRATSRHTANEAARRQQFNAIIEALRVQLGDVQADSTKADVLIAAKLRLAHLQAQLDAARAANKAAAAGGGEAGAAGPLRVSSAAFGDSAAELDSADSTPGGRSGGGGSPLSPASTDAAAVAATPKAAGAIQVEVTDAGGSADGALAPAAMLVAQVHAPLDAAAGAAPLLAAAAAALATLPLALRNAAVCSAAATGKATLTFELQAREGLPAGTRTVDVRNSLAALIAQATAAPEGVNDADAKRRRTD